MEKLFRNFEALGEIYCDRHLNKTNTKDLENDSWAALDFFFSKSFMRGRRDELSVSFKEHTMLVLKNFFNNDYNQIIENGNFQIEWLKSKKIGRGNILKDKTFINNIENAKFKNLVQSLISPFDGSKKSIKKLTNGADLIMVVHVLNLIKSENINNIYSWIKEKIENNSIPDLYKIKGNYIGDKIYTFLLRDIVLLNIVQLKDKLESEDTFPIDTWVEQVAKRIKPDIKKIQIKSFFITKSIEYNLNSLKVAAGIWLIGSHSFEISWTLLENTVELNKQISEKVIKELKKSEDND